MINNQPKAPASGSLNPEISSQQFYSLCRSSRYETHEQSMDFVKRIDDLMVHFEPTTEHYCALFKAHVDNLNKHITPHTTITPLVRKLVQGRLQNLPSNVAFELVKSITTDGRISRSKEAECSWLEIAVELVKHLPPRDVHEFLVKMNIFYLYDNWCAFRDAFQALSKEDANIHKIISELCNKAESQFKTIKKYDKQAIKIIDECELTLKTAIFIARLTRQKPPTIIAAVSARLSKIKPTWMFGEEARELTDMANNLYHFDFSGNYSEEKELPQQQNMAQSRKGFELESKETKPEQPQNKLGSAAKVGLFAASQPAVAVPTPQKEEEIPEAFLCPITQELMDDPVILLDGTGDSYERKAITEWLLKKSKTSPLTGKPVEFGQDVNSVLTPNKGLRESISDYKKKHPQPHKSVEFKS